MGSQARDGISPVRPAALGESNADYKSNCRKHSGAGSMTHASRLAAQLRLAAKESEDEEQAERLEERADEVEEGDDDG